MHVYDIFELPQWSLFRRSNRKPVPYAHACSRTHVTTCKLLKHGADLLCRGQEYLRYVYLLALLNIFLKTDG